jgi:hypothetical protein
VAGLEDELEAPATQPAERRVGDRHLQARKRARTSIAVATSKAVTEPRLASAPASSPSPRPRQAETAQAHGAETLEPPTVGVGDGPPTMRLNQPPRGRRLEPADRVASREDSLRARIVTTGHAPPPLSREREGLARRWRPPSQHLAVGDDDAIEVPGERAIERLRIARRSRMPA